MHRTKYSRPTEFLGGYVILFNYFGQNVIPNQSWGLSKTRKVCPPGQNFLSSCLALALSNGVLRTSSAIEVNLGQKWSVRINRKFGLFEFWKIQVKKITQKIWEPELWGFKGTRSVVGTSRSSRGRQKISRITYTCLFRRLFIGEHKTFLIVSRMVCGNGIVWGQDVKRR